MSRFANGAAFRSNFAEPRNRSYVGWVRRDGNWKDRKSAASRERIAKCGLRRNRMKWEAKTTT